MFKSLTYNEALAKVKQKELKRKVKICKEGGVPSLGKLLTMVHNSRKARQKPQKALKRTKLAKVSKSPRAVLKTEIQALLRKIVIARDGGCILRNLTGIRPCGCYDKDDNLILQAEHLVTRSSTNYFGDTRNVVCLCKYHHIIWKPQYSKDYWEAIEKVLPPSRWQWYLRAKADNRAYPVDLKIVKIGLENELKKYG